LLSFILIIKNYGEDRVAANISIEGVKRVGVRRQCRQFQIQIAGHDDIPYEFVNHNH
jgi:alpha-D-ribose 1-methylphosphonate 5-triphosphate diphosphatase PhnM